ncbi:MAG: zf-HC2 domain-containing protein [Candidatus Acidiferrales bacterium]
MDCQKKSEQMTARINDLALGELSPKSELELLAHVAECEACREAYDHARAVRTVVDRGAETLVAGEPSPQFITRLRARIAAEPAPRRWSCDVWRIWEQGTRQRLAYAASAVVLATLLIAAVTGLPHRRVSTPTVAEVVPSTTPSLHATAAFPKATTIQDHSRKEVTSRSVPSPRIRREPEVMVPKGELLAVVKFYEAVHNTPVDNEELYAAQEEPQKPLEVKPIEITPLEPLETPVDDSDKGPGLF